MSGSATDPATVAEAGKQAKAAAESSGSASKGLIESVKSAAELKERITSSSLKPLVVGGDGVSVDEVKENYDCTDGTAYVVRGLSRMADVDTVPPIADVAVGIAKLVGGRE